MKQLRRSKWDNMLPALLQGYKAGSSTYLLSKEFQIPPNSVWYLLRRAGLTLRAQKEMTHQTGLKNLRHYSLDWCPELAYVCGVLHGDGWVYGSHIGINVNDAEFAAAFSQGLKTLGIHSYTDLNRQGQTRVRAYSGYFARWWAANKDVLSNLDTEELLPHFLRGFYDSEGTLGKRAHQRHFHLSLRISNTKRHLIDFVYSALSKRGFTPHIYPHSSPRFGTKLCYILFLGRKEEIKAFVNWVKPTIARKGDTSWIPSPQL